MPKKQIAKRLDKLFEEIRQDEASAPPKRRDRARPTPPRGVATEPPVPASQSRPTRPTTTGRLRLPESLAMSTMDRPGTPAVMSLAFRSGQRDWATLRVVNEETPRPWSQDEQLLLEQVADQLSLALENARLFAETQTRAQELAVLNELARSLAAQLDVRQVLEETYRGVARLLDATNFFIGLYDPGRNEIAFHINVSESGIDREITTIRADEGIPGHILSTRAPLLIRENLSTWLKETGIEPVGELAQSWLGVPLLLGDQILGLMAVQNYTRPNAYDEHDRDLLMAFANQAAVAIQNARLFEETQQRANELALINRIMSAVATSLDLEVNLQTIAEELAQHLSADHVGIALMDNTKTRLVLAADAPAPPGGSPDLGITIPIQGNPPTEEVISTRKPLFIEDVLNNPLAAPIREVMRQRGTVNLCILPLLAGQEVIGTIGIDFFSLQRKITDNETRLLETVVLQTATAIQNARLFSETQQLNLAIQSGTDILVVTDIDGQITFVNQAFTDVTGYTFEEVAGNTPRILKSGLHPPELYAELWSTILAGEVWHGELTNRRKDGRLYMVDETILPVKDRQGNVTGFTSIQRDVSEQKQAEKIRNAIYQITDAALASQNLDVLFPAVHEVIGSLIPARNFYIALYDQTADLISFPYYVDEHDQAWPPQKPGSGLTSHVLRTGRALLATPQVIEELTRRGEVQPDGTPGVDWLGVPLRAKGAVVGVMAVQSYDEAVRLTDEHRETLTLLATQVASAIERIQSAQALARSEGELRALFASMTDVILIYDKEGRYLRIAPTNPSRLYRPPEELIGKKINEVLPPETHEVFMAAIQQVLESGETYTFEYPLEIGGKVYWFDAGVSKLDEERVFWVARDITDRKAAEEALRRQNEYLAAAAEIGRLITSTLDLNALFDRAVNLVRERFGFYHAAIFIIEETGFNAVLRAATGEAGEEMKRRQHSLAVGSKSIVGMVTSSGAPVVVNNTAIDPIHRANPLLPETRAEAGVPLRIGTRIIGALDIQSTEVDAFTEADIAVLQSLADQIAVAIDNARSYELAQQAVKEMREVDRLKSQFLANMSHELRTPLNSIIGFARVIMKGIDGPITDLQQQDLTAIFNSGQHLLGLINDILDLSRIEAGKMELSFDEVQLGDIINSVMSTATGLVKDKSITLKRSIPPDLPPVRADAMRVRQILLNLLSNAAKFTEKGSISVEAAVKTGPAGHSEIMVSVSDTGPGITLEDQARLFQPFSQVDSSPTRKTGGSGLGLSICQHLVQMHGGRIGIHSALGKGSTFYFTLPVYRGKDEGPVADNARVILAIDDDPQVISLYERYLQPQGYQVIALTDPSRACERVRLLRPFAVTLDIMMPGYDGWQVLAELKADPQTRDTPVIICSIVEEEEKGFSLGAADYLVKPILEDDLLNALNRLNGDGSIREVLVIDDDPHDLRLIGNMLSEHGRYKPILAEGGTRGWEVITANTPHAIVLDLFMPDLDGFTILEKLRGTRKLRDIPVVVVSAGDLNAEQREQLASLGQRLLQKSSLTEKELIATLERALRRVPTAK